MDKGDDLKRMYTPAVVRELAERLHAADPTFPKAAFVKDATRGLAALEMKDRVRHLARAMRTHLHAAYPQALPVLIAAMGQTRGRVAMRGFELWPFCHFVEAYGLDDFDISLDAIHKLTQQFTCEFAIRPYLIARPQQVLTVLREWARDPNPHVRRLVSEGTRPRLPWGCRLPALQKDPQPILALLEMLYRDPELFVRRSVANNLNDIGKDNPDVVVATVRRWSEDADAQDRWVIKHALRSLVKAGHPEALAVLGFGPAAGLAVELSLEEASAVVGGHVPMRLRIRSKARREQRLVIDYALHHQKANGTLSPKVFKWAHRTIKPRETLDLVRQHNMRLVTTRRYYPGLHRVEVLINGTSRASAAFVLQVP